MIDQEKDTSTNQKKQELKELIRNAKRLDVARSISLPAAGIASIFSALVGPIAFLGTSGIGSAVIGFAKHQLANKRSRAFALASELHSEGEITNQDFEDYLRVLRNATEGSAGAV